MSHQYLIKINIIISRYTYTSQYLTELYDMNQNFSKSRIVFFLISLVLLFSSFNGLASDSVKTITTADDSDIDVRIFSAEGDKLLIGFACDQGSSVSEEKTSEALAKDGIEVWMPDMLSAYMLAKVRSSLSEIPTDGLIEIIEEAKKTKKKIYLVASGPDTELVLRALADWEKTHADSSGLLGGAILMFPRLNKGKPEPGKPPQYQDAVGKTKSPLIVLEGERTPNRWGVGHLTNALKISGSTVYAKLIPDVRGYFFKRNDPNVPEDLVTSQMSGLIKASLFFLGKAHK